MSKTHPIPAVVDAGEGYEPAARHRDPRLPAPGTTLTRRVRSGETLTLQVDADAFSYGGASYRTISGATKAACEEHGMKPQNGYIFWGLIKPERRPGVAPKIPFANALEILDQAWKRYHKVVSQVALNVEKTPDPEAAVATIDEHRSLIDDLYCQAYDGWQAQLRLDAETLPAEAEAAEAEAKPKEVADEIHRQQRAIASALAPASAAFIGGASPAPKKKRTKRGVKSRRTTGPVS